MRFCYADPPYPGKARRYYGDHADFAGEVDHRALIAELETYDGWALSTSAAALHEVLPLCPPPTPRGASGGGARQQFRVLAWCKAVGQPGDPTSAAGPAPLYCWEPVILRGGRAAPVDTPEGLRPRDWLVASPELYTFRAKPEGAVIGAKPLAFCDWLFACAGLRPDDEFVDLFPGSGAVSEAWERWRQQITIVMETRVTSTHVYGQPELEVEGSS